MTEIVASGTTVSHHASPWMTAQEAASYVRLFTKTLYREVRLSRCRAARVGGRKLVFKRDWLDAYLDQRATPVDVRLTPFSPEARHT